MKRDLALTGRRCSERVAEPNAICRCVVWLSTGDNVLVLTICGQRKFAMLAEQVLGQATKGPPMRGTRVASAGRRIAQLFCRPARFCLSCTGTPLIGGSHHRLDQLNLKQARWVKRSKNALDTE